MIQCPRCKGKGWYYVTDPCDHEDVVGEECRNCDGKGVIDDPMGEHINREVGEMRKDL